MQVMAETDCRSVFGKRFYRSAVKSEAGSFGDNARRLSAVLEFHYMAEHKRGYGASEFQRQALRAYHKRYRGVYCYIQ